MKPTVSHCGAKNGQTLVEVIVILGVVAVLVTGLVAASSSALRASESGKSRTLATKYAQEGIELTRRLRDSGWTTFYTYGNTDPGKPWCVDGTGVWTSGAGGCDINIEQQYTRTVTIEWIDATKVEVNSMISWVEGDSTNPQTVSLTTYLTQWR